MGFNLADYETVKDRIMRFYADHKEGSITTELVSNPDDIDKKALFKAYVYIGDKLKSTGYAFEAIGQGVNKDAWVENSETSAIGRALANLDYCGGKRPSREEMSKTSVARDVESMSDMRRSDGAMTPPVESGAPSVRGDGVADAMRKGRIAFNNLMAEKYEGNPIFSPEELKDMNADLFPGGRILSSSQADLDYLRSKYVKWTDRKNVILSASMDAIADEGFALSMAKE